MGGRKAHPSYYLSLKNLSRYFTRGCISVFIIVFTGLLAATATGAELHVALLEAVTKGDLIKFPFPVDKVESLAGIKLSLMYNQDIRLRLFSCLIKNMDISFGFV